MIKRSLVLGLFIAVLAGTSSWAAVRYLSTSGTDSGTCSSSGSPCLTVNYAQSQASAGDDFEFAVGTYTASGSIDGFSGANSSNPSEYYCAEVLKCTIKNSAPVDITGATYHDISLGGFFFWSTGSNPSVAIESPDGTALASQTYNIHISTCYGYGAPHSNYNNAGWSIARISSSSIVNSGNIGARYSILIYGCLNMFLDGILASWENWTPSGGQNPAGGIALYDVRNSTGIHFRVYDAGAGVSSFDGDILDKSGIYTPSNNNSGTSQITVNQNIFLYSSLVVNNNLGNCFANEGGSGGNNSNINLINAALLGCDGVGMTIPQKSSSFTGNHITVASACWNGNDAALYSGVSGTTFKNGIVEASGADGISGNWTLSYNNVHGSAGSAYSGGASAGANSSTIDPAIYHAMVSTSMATAGDGESGSDMGADLRFKYDITGNVTAVKAWPVPYECTIKDFYKRTIGLSYGIFGTTYTYTQYFWRWRYGHSPASGYDSTCTDGVAYSDSEYGLDTTSPTAPGTPTVTSTGTTTLDLSWSASTDAVGVTSYEIDVSTDGFSTKSAGYDDFDMGSGTTEQLTGLTAGTAYTFRIRAKDAAGNTSSNSSAGFGTTNSPTSAVSSPKTLSKLDFGVYVVNFGLYASSATWITEIALAKEMGAGVIRSNWDMEDKIWTSSLTWDFGYITWVAQYAAANGIKLYMTLPWRATWQTGHSSCQGTNPYAGTGTPSTTQCPDASITNQGIFASSMATALDRYIDTYELYNEFDLLSASTVTAHKAGIAAAQAKAILDVNPAARIAIVCTASPKLTLYNGNTTSGATQFPGHHELSAFYSAFSSSLTYIGHGVTMSSFTTSAHPYFRAVGDNQTFQLCMTTISAMSGNFGNDTPTIDFTEGFAFGGSASGSYPAWEIDKSSAFARAFAIHQSSNSAWGGNGGRIIIHNMAGYDFSATTTSYAKRPLFVMGKRLFELNGFYSHGDQGDGTNVRKYKFTQGNRTVWIVWTESGTSSWSLNPSGVVDVTDIYGIRQLHKANEFSPYTITTAPVVVEEVVAARRVTGGTLQ